MLVMIKPAVHRATKFSSFYPGSHFGQSSVISHLFSPSVAFYQDLSGSHLFADWADNIKRILTWFADSPSQNSTKHLSRMCSVRQSVDSALMVWTRNHEHTKWPKWMIITMRNCFGIKPWHLESSTVLQLPIFQPKRQPVMLNGILAFHRFLSESTMLAKNTNHSGTQAKSTWLVAWHTVWPG